MAGQRSPYRNGRMGHALFLEHLLGLIDLCGKIRASTTVRMVQQHELAVMETDLLWCQRPLTVPRESAIRPCRAYWGERRGKVGQ